MDISSVRDISPFVLSVVIGMYILGRSIVVLAGPDLISIDLRASMVGMEMEVMTQIEILGLRFTYAAGSVLWPLMFVFLVNHSQRYRIRAPFVYFVLIVHSLVCSYAIIPPVLHSVELHRKSSHAYDWCTSTDCIRDKSASGSNNLASEQRRARIAERHDETRENLVSHALYVAIFATAMLAALVIYNRKVKLTDTIEPKIE